MAAVPVAAAGLQLLQLDLAFVFFSLFSSLVNVTVMAFGDVSGDETRVFLFCLERTLTM